MLGRHAVTIPMAGSMQVQTLDGTWLSINGLVDTELHITGEHTCGIQALL